jgi:hypothetical protein
VVSLYVYWLLGKVASQRYNLYSTFLMIPTGCLRALATKQLLVSVADDDDDRDLPMPDTSHGPSQVFPSSLTRCLSSLQPARRAGSIC